MRWNRIATAALAAALALGLAGCPPARRPGAPETPAPAPAAPAPAPAAPAPTAPAPTAPAPTAPGVGAGAASEAAARADALADVAAGIKGVRGAWVVVAGDTAYCGIDVDGPGRTPEANRALEQQVARTLQAAPHGIRTAYVSTKPEVLQAIQNIAEGVRAGHPFARFAGELDKLVGEMTPTAR